MDWPIVICLAPDTVRSQMYGDDPAFAIPGTSASAASDLAIALPLAWLKSLEVADLTGSGSIQISHEALLLFITHLRFGGSSAHHRRSGKAPADSARSGRHAAHATASGRATAFGRASASSTDVAVGRPARLAPFSRSLPRASWHTLGIRHRLMPSTARRRHTLCGPCQRCGLAGPLGSTGHPRDAP